MALVSFTKGLKENLPTSEIIEGALYLTTDTGEMHYGKSINELLKITDTDKVSNNHFNETVNNIQTSLNNKAPAYTYGTEDLEAGVSTLAAGTLYFVYE